MKGPLSKKKSLKSTTAVAVKVLQGKLQRVMEWMVIHPYLEILFFLPCKELIMSGPPLNPKPRTKLTLNL